MLRTNPAIGGRHLESMLPSGACRGLLYGTGQQTEFIPFRIGEHNPSGLGCLAHVDPLGPEIQQAAELIALSGSICTKVKVKPVLHRLLLAHESEFDDWPQPVWWAYVRPGGIEKEDLPTKSSTPELGHPARIDSSYRNGRDSACHAPSLPSEAVNGYPTQQ